MGIDLDIPKFITIDRHRIAYSQFGQGLPIALLHGIPTSRYLWRQIIPLLVERGCEVTALDLLGYGQSDQPEDADLGVASQAKLMGAALKAIGWSDGALVGHDIGGGIAQLVAVDQTSLINCLVLVDTIAYDSFPIGVIARLNEPIWDGILGAPDFDLKKGLRKSFEKGMVNTDRISPEMIATYEKPFSGVQGRLAYLRAARALRTGELATRMAEVEALQTPTLVVWGAEDVFQPIAYGGRLAAALANGRFERIAAAGHFLPEDQPERLVELIHDFAVQA
jgi:pimeloyl-ACP methyl ester carboxylesterase